MNTPWTQRLRNDIIQHRNIPFFYKLFNFKILDIKSLKEQVAELNKKHDLLLQHVLKDPQTDKSSGKS